MFARSSFGNQFQPFAFGASPFTAGAGIGGVNPFASQAGGYTPFFAPQFNPIGAHPGLGNLPLQAGNYGFNPFLSGLTQAFNPTINPLIAAQLAAFNPGVLQGLTPQTGGGQFGQLGHFGVQPAQAHPGYVNPLFQLNGIEGNYFGHSPFWGQLGGPSGWGGLGQGITPFNALANPFGQSVAGGLQAQIPNYNLLSPFTVQDPLTATLLAQQANPLAQQRLPIRPLTGAQHLDPYQAGLSGLTGSAQATDPYLAQAQLMAQCAGNPMQQIARSYSSGNWTGAPYTMGQPFPIGQTPYNI